MATSSDGSTAGRTLRRVKRGAGEITDVFGRGVSRFTTGVVGLAYGLVGLAQAAIVGTILVVGYLAVVVEWTVLSTLVTAYRFVATLAGVRDGDLSLASLWAVDVMDDRPSAAKLVLSVGLAFGLDAKTAMDGHLAQIHAWKVRRPVVPGLVTVLGGLVIGYLPMMVALKFALVPGNYMFVGVIFSILVVLSGLFAIGKPEFSSFFGAFAIAVSVLSIVGALGGLFVGLLVGITGGSLLYAWQPPSNDVSTA